MTFTEAAAEVLRLVGKPLHYKDITDLAIQKNLLSHVGKSPEVTMGSRLAALLKKGPKENPLVRIKPGVFALRAWEEGGPPGPAADAGDLASVPAAPAGGAGPESGPVVAPPPAPIPSSTVVALPLSADEHKSAPAPDEVLRAEMAAKATEMFTEEEDDDKPILGEDPAEAAGGRRRRRRRRRGGEGAGAASDAPDTGDGLPSYTVSPAFGDGAPAPILETEAREGGVVPIQPREGGDRPEPREPREGRNRDRGDRPDRGERGDRDRGEARERGDRGDRGPERERGGDRDRGPRVELPPLAEGDEAVGRDMAETLLFVLAGFDRNGGPVPLRTLAEAGQRRGKLQGDLSVVQSMMAAAARADNLRRTSEGKRPRFRIVGGRIGATDWALGSDLVRAEADALAAIDRFREVSRRTLARKIGELPGHALVELVITVLEKLGVHQIRGVRRPGAPGGEAHLTGVLRAVTGDQVLAIVIRKDGKEVGRERVIEVRGSLHHYGAATTAFLVTTGQVLSGAREEAAAAGTTPVALFDGVGLAKACEEHGVGTLRTLVPVAIPDVDFLEAIRGT